MKFIILRHVIVQMKCEQTLAVKDIEQKLLQGEKEIEMLQRRLEQLEKASAEEVRMFALHLERNIAEAHLLEHCTEHSPTHYCKEAYRSSAA